eukprot:3049001-Pleurochrysis_carterae.AAC.1
MVQRICNIRDEECIGGKPWEPGLDENRINYMGVMLIKVMWHTGHRLGEAVKRSSELTYFVRSDITFRIKGVLMEDPSADEPENMTDGDVVCLEASRYKTDFAGIEYSPIPSVLPYRCEQITNAAAAL